MPVEVFANQPRTAVVSGGTTAPVSGTQETWTVASSASFPAASSGASPPTQFHVADPQLTSEVIAVSNVSGVTWTVTRGAEGTTPVVHASGFTVYQVVTAGGLGLFLQQAENLSDVASAPSARANLGLGTAATVNVPVPVADGGTGQATASAALNALGGAAVAGDIGGTSASPQVTATHLASALPIAQGGTGQATQQSAINALTGAQSSGKYLRSDGANAALANISAVDVPTLNQNTSGTASGLSSTLAIGSGGTGQVTQQAAIDALTGTQTAGTYARSDGTHTTLSAIQAADVPTLNQSTTGTAKAPDIQFFTSSGTWTKPAGAQAVYAAVLGGGAGRRVRCVRRQRDRPVRRRGRGGRVPRHASSSPPTSALRSPSR